MEKRRRRPRARRHLHQCRLHPEQGAAAVQREFRTRGEALRRPRHRPEESEHRHQEDAGPQGQRRQAEQRRHPVPVQEEQGELLPRPRQLRRRHGGRLAGQGRRRGADGQADHRRHRFQRARAAGCGFRRREDPQQRRCAASRRGAEEAGPDRCRRDRPRDGLRLASPGRRGHGARRPAGLSGRGRRTDRQGSAEGLRQAGAEDRTRRQGRRGQDDARRASASPTPTPRARRRPWRSTS